MPGKHLISAIGSIFSIVCPLMAQNQPATLAALEFQKPKLGMTVQYEAGRKQKAAWHRQQNDPQPLYVWEILSGENTGTYIVGRLGQHWADFDKPAIPDEVDRGEFLKVIAGFVDSVIARYYQFMPKISNPTDDKMPSKFAEIITFYVRYDKGSEFQSAIDQVTAGAQKTKWPPNYSWFQLANGGPSGEFVLVLPRKNWADFEDKPDVKPLRDMLKDAFGQAEADSIINRIDGSVVKETTEIIRFHPELSYLPAK